MAYGKTSMTISYFFFLYHLFYLLEQHQIYQCVIYLELMSVIVIITEIVHHGEYPGTEIHNTDAELWLQREERFGTF